MKATSRNGRSSRHAACEMPYARTTTRRDSWWKICVFSKIKTSEVMNDKDLRTRAEAWLKARMERLTPRQRLGLVTVLLLVYAAVALMILFGGMRSRETSIPAVEHLRQPLLPERSLLPLNTSEDDTQER